MQSSGAPSIAGMTSAFKDTLKSPRAFVLQLSGEAFRSAVQNCAYDGGASHQKDAAGSVIRKPGRSFWTCDACVQGVYANASESAAFNASCVG